MPARCGVFPPEKADRRGRMRWLADPIRSHPIRSDPILSDPIRCGHDWLVTPRGIARKPSSMQRHALHCWSQFCISHAACCIRCRYEFDATSSAPTCIAYHPSQYAIACGFADGCLRIFDVSTTAVMEEYRQAYRACLPAAARATRCRAQAARRVRRGRAVYARRPPTLLRRHVHSTHAHVRVRGCAAIG